MDNARESFGLRADLMPAIGLTGIIIMVQKLAVAVQNLPERERTVVTLYYHEELTLREIGEILSLSEGRICQIFGQAVKRLRAVLGIKPRESSTAKRQDEARRAQQIKKTVQA